MLVTWSDVQAEEMEKWKLPSVLGHFIFFLMILIYFCYFKKLKLFWWKTYGAWKCQGWGGYTVYKSNLEGVVDRHALPAQPLSHLRILNGAVCWWLRDSPVGTRYHCSPGGPAASLSATHPPAQTPLHAGWGLERMAPRREGSKWPRTP